MWLCVCVCDIELIKILDIISLGKLKEINEVYKQIYKLLRKLNIIIMNF